jgi:hypothetical protein
MDRLIAHFLLTKLLLVLWAVVTLPVWLPLVWLARWLEARGDQQLLAWGIRIILFMALLALWWISKQMSYYMTVEKRTFRYGVKAGILDAKLRLAFVPLVGHWFDSKAEHFNKDDDAT